MNEAFM